MVRTTKIRSVSWLVLLLSILPMLALGQPSDTVVPMDSSIPSSEPSMSLSPSESLASSEPSMSLAPSESLASSEPSMSLAPSESPASGEPSMSLAPTDGDANEPSMSLAPSDAPIPSPIGRPSASPSSVPTISSAPTMEFEPTPHPSQSAKPSSSRTPVPTRAPVRPTPVPIVRTPKPTRAPVTPTRAPVTPTRVPVTPTRAPIVIEPVSDPTPEPAEPTDAPVLPDAPTRAPVLTPTRSPVAPTKAPIAVQSPAVTGFTVVDADTNLDFSSLENGDVLVLGTPLSINIRANTVGAVGSVLFELNGEAYRIENVVPYALAGDIESDYFTWIPSSLGVKVLKATIYDGPSGQGSPVASSEVTFSVVFPTTNGPTRAPAGSPTSVPVSGTAAPVSGPVPTAAPVVPATPVPTKSPAPTVDPIAACMQRKVCVDFDTTPDNIKVDHGTYVSDQWMSLGIRISAQSITGGYTPDDQARILDTATPGTDTDLGSPNEYCPDTGNGRGPGTGFAGEPGMEGENCKYEGNVLIIQESPKEDVDDNGDGGNIIFEFTSASTVLSMGLLDLDEGETGSLFFEDADSGAITLQMITGLGNNAVQDVTVERENLKKMTLAISNSGAVRFICFCPELAPTPTPTSAPVFPATSAPTPTLLLPTPFPTRAPIRAPLNICVNFDTTAAGVPIRHGEYVRDQWLAWGVKVTAMSVSGGYTPDGQARIMDTARPGADPDLGTPNEYCSPAGPGQGAGGKPGMVGANCKYEGNVLIIQEEDKDEVDDNADGGTLRFDFARPVILDSIGLLDLDEGISAIISIEKSDGSFLPVLPVEDLGDNSVQEVTFVNEGGIIRMYLGVQESGAVRHLCYHYME